MRSLLVTALLVALALVQRSEGHGYLRDPPSRSSLWREMPNVTANYNDMGLNCNGHRTKCGVCGDGPNGPFDNEAGGKFASGIISRHYREGDTIKVTVVITANHAGWFEFHLCPNNNVHTRVTEDCMMRQVLSLADGSTRYQLSRGQVGPVELQVKLPAGVTCSQCVFRWKWVAGNSWGSDGSGNSCVGCGDKQEKFFGCADVSIGSQGGQFPSYTNGPIKPSQATYRPGNGFQTIYPPTTRPQQPWNPWNPFNQQTVTPQPWNPNTPQPWNPNTQRPQTPYNPYVTGTPAPQTARPWYPNTQNPYPWNPATPAPQTQRPYTPSPWKPATQPPNTQRPQTSYPVTIGPQTQRPYNPYNPYNPMISGPNQPYPWNPLTPPPPSWNPWLQQTVRPQTQRPFNPFNPLNPYQVTSRPQTQKPYSPYPATSRPQTQTPFPYNPNTAAPFTQRPYNPQTVVPGWPYTPFPYNPNNIGSATQNPYPYNPQRPQTQNPYPWNPPTPKPQTQRPYPTAAPFWPNTPFPQNPNNVVNPTQNPYPYNQQTAKPQTQNPYPYNPFRPQTQNPYPYNPVTSAPLTGRPGWPYTPFPSYPNNFQTQRPYPTAAPQIGGQIGGQVGGGQVGGITLSNLFGLNGQVGGQIGSQVTGQPSGQLGGSLGSLSCHAINEWSTVDDMDEWCTNNCNNNNCPANMCQCAKKKTIKD